MKMGKKYIIHRVCDKCNKIKRVDTEFPEDTYNYYGYGNICLDCIYENNTIVTPEVEYDGH